MGHNMPLVCIGVFLLWFGWYGFNGGSVLSADPILVSYVFVTTTLSAAGGIIGSMLASEAIKTITKISKNCQIFQDYDFKDNLSREISFNKNAPFSLEVNLT